MTKEEDQMAPASKIGIHGRREPLTVKRLAMLVGVACACLVVVLLLVSALSGHDDGSVIVFPWDPLSEHGGALKLINIMPIDANCQAGNGCNHVVIPNCSVRCVYTDGARAADEAHVVLYHPDILDDMGKYKRRLYGGTRDKKEHQLFAVMGHEPVWQRPSIWLDPSVTSVFDFTVHWGSNSDVPTNFYYFDEIHYGRDIGQWWKNTSMSHFDELLDQWQYFSDASRHTLSVLSEAKDKKERKDVLGDPDGALISTIVSNCESKVRIRWMKDIMSFIPTASYGKCLTNADGDKHRVEKQKVNGRNPRDAEWDFTQDLMNQKIEMISRHPFHLAIESTNNEAGWVTEKIYQALMAGTVPIYWGNSKAVAEVAPPGSYIDATEFENAYDLAVYLKLLMTDKSRYEAFHEWRYKPETTELFERIMADRRSTAACRVCEYYHNEYRAKNYQHKPGRLVYTLKDGWLRK